jgi:hypothetical protein
MSTDYAEKEREFIASLQDDTGRDLDAWMAAISTCGRDDRNDIIDWLRHQGFPFAKASWLERIHHNGGRVIYGDEAGSRKEIPASDSAVAANARPAAASMPARTGTAAPAAAMPQPSGSQQTATGVPVDVAQLLAAAKGLRPLAEMILHETRLAVPGTALGMNGPFVILSAPFPFAALLPAPRQLRLYADFGPHASAQIRTADTINRLAPPFTQMMLLDDARQIDDAFRRLIRAAAGARQAEPRRA